MSTFRRLAAPPSSDSSLPCLRPFLADILASAEHDVGKHGKQRKINARARRRTADRAHSRSATNCDELCQNASPQCGPRTRERLNRRKMKHTTRSGNTTRSHTRNEEHRKPQWVAHRFAVFSALWTICRHGSMLAAAHLQWLLPRRPQPDLPQPNSCTHYQGQPHVSIHPLTFGNNFVFRSKRARQIILPVSVLVCAWFGGFA